MSKLTEEEKLKIINKIKDHIHTDNIGYCSVLWAARAVFNDKNFSLTKWQIKTISSIITRDGKYLKEIIDKDSFYDTEISINPNSNWFTQNPIKTELIKGVAAISIAFITSILTTHCVLKNEQSETTQDKLTIDTQLIEPKPDPKEAHKN